MGRTKGKTIAIVALSLLLPATAVSLFLAMFTIFFFDAPGSTEAPFTILLAASIWSFPVLALVGAAGAALLGFTANRTENDASYRVRVRAALAFTLLPLISVAVGVVATILIMAVCDGSFVCR
jgi:hypothetical protein